MSYTHFFSFDPTFCGSTEAPRLVAPDAASVTCPQCRRNACADHALHGEMLGHVADFCPDCEQEFDDVIDAVRSWR